MRNFVVAVQSLCVLFWGAFLFSQDIPPAKIEKEHKWLKQFVGKWDYTSKSVEGQGMPSMECKGSMDSTSLGELWIVNRVETNMGVMNVTAIQTVGYDSNSKKFVGTWVDSMLNHLWRYEGHVDASGKTLFLEAEGPNFAEEGKTAKFRDSYEFKSPDHIIGRSSMQGSDGKWFEFMVGEFKRAK